MGTYLSTPILEKHIEEGSDIAEDPNIPVRWAVVDMQGWRKSMEDAHVARTDVMLPKCYTEQPGGGGGESAEEEGAATTNKNDTGAANAKVFAVFDGHGGAEAARYCQINLVSVLTSQSHWKGIQESTTGDENKSTAFCVGQSLVDSFHALDRMIDDPNQRQEIGQWRSERPAPYVHGAAGGDDDAADVEMGGTEYDEKLDVQNEPMELDDAQQRRHTVMDASEISEDAAKLHMIDDEETGSDNTSENSDEGATDKSEESAMNDNGEKGREDYNGTSNTMSDADDGDKVSDDSMENKASDGVVHDDSDDEKEERTNESDGGEVEKPAAGDKPEKGKIALAANDAVALFQKLLHMKGTSEDDVIDDGLQVVEDSSAAGESDGGQGPEVAIPTKEQLLNPPTGVVLPSVSVPTRIHNGRKVCNLPDHAIHAGCTSVVAVVVGRTLVVANAGDSRAVICRAGGLTEPLSFDHKPLQNREMNRITNAGGFVNQFGRVNGNLNLSRSIGDLKYKQVPGIHPAEQMITAEPDILSTTLRAGDEFIILGCDGIWDCLTNEECVKYVYDRIDSKTPQEIGAEMLDDIVSADPRASQGIGGDNMTIMIVDLLPHTRAYSTD